MGGFGRFLGHFKKAGLPLRSSRLRGGILGCCSGSLVLLAFLLPIPAPSRADDPLLGEGPGFAADIDEKATFDQCRRDAQKGDPKAQGILGLMYEEGRGTEKDYAEALRWLEKGARKGDADAQNNLAILYFKGLGVERDYGQALKWFLKSAGQGLASAQSNLGLIYARGLGVPQDYAKALGWFRKAAEQDDPDAEENLGVLYSLGEGSPKDYVESYFWFSQALKHTGLQDSRVEDLRDDIEWLEKHMTDRQAAEAGKRVSQGKSTPTP